MTGLHSAAAALFSAALLASARAETLDQTLARMDRTAETFKGVKASLRQTQHLAVINDDNVNIGTLLLKRSRRDVRVLVHLTSPDDKTIALSGNKVEMYLPKLKTVQEYNFGSQTVEKFLGLGFGASGSELKADYSITALGDDPAAPEKTARLELIPKDKQVLHQFPKIELWIPESKGYPVQEKFYETGGDYMLIVYSDIALNPSLPDSAFKLLLPKGVKRVTP